MCIVLHKSGRSPSRGHSISSSLSLESETTSLTQPTQSIQYRFENVQVCKYNLLVILRQPHNNTNSCSSPCDQIVLLCIASFVAAKPGSLYAAAPAYYAATAPLAAPYIAAAPAAAATALTYAAAAPLAYSAAAASPAAAYYRPALSYAAPYASPYAYNAAYQYQRAPLAAYQTAYIH